MRIFSFVVLLELCLIASVRAEETAARPVFHPDGKYVKVNGVALWYESEGNGEPIVLIAGGLGFSHSYFHPQSIEKFHDPRCSSQSHPPVLI